MLSAYWFSLNLIKAVVLEVSETTLAFRILVRFSRSQHLFLIIKESQMLKRVLVAAKICAVFQGVSESNPGLFPGLKIPQSVISQKTRCPPSLASL